MTSNNTSLHFDIKCKRCRAITSNTIHFQSLDNTYFEIACTCPKCGKIHHMYIKLGPKLIVTKH